ncbi:IQ motif, EF-hand binding site [Phytophthora cactorum]|nr:IQ motif, EF-hand binding site [Phytophthora cactorum]
MSMEDQAATCIQARFRAFRWRKLQRRRVESFQQATRRRQIRIWCNEQELYFLQHTNAADLERVRAFQQQHSARLIQRCWRAVNNSMVASKGDKEEVVAPSDRIYTFDPFGLATPDTKARTDHRRQWSRDNESSEFSPLSPSLFINAKELRASASPEAPGCNCWRRSIRVQAEGDPGTVSSTHELTLFCILTRSWALDRIKGKAAQEKVKSRSATKARDTKEGSNPVVNRRRELYEQVVAMKYATAQRVLQYERGSRASRQERELFLLSCRVVSANDAFAGGQQLVHDEAAMMERWDPARRIRAWNHHRRAVCSVLDKRRWWQTQLAGDERDIRQVVVAKSPGKTRTRSGFGLVVKIATRRITIEPARLRYGLRWRFTASSWRQELGGTKQPVVWSCW